MAAAAKTNTERVYARAVHDVVRALWTLSVLILLLSGCAVSPEVRKAADRVAEQTSSSQLSCAPEAVNRCAESSALLIRAREAEDSSRNYIRLMELGDEALLARLHLIRGATVSIDLQTYIFHADSSGEWLMDELLKAARRGVQVRVLFDQFGSSHDFLYLINRGLKHENLHFAFYNPIWNELKTSLGDMVGNLACCFRNFNRRMHNKLFVVDDQLALIGGRNVADNYFDLDPDYTFVDRGALVMGPVVGDLSDSFEHYWMSDITVRLHKLDDVSEYLAAKGVPHVPSRRQEARLQDLVRRLQNKASLETLLLQRLHAAADVRFFADHPGKPEAHDQPAWEDISTAIHEVIASARESLLIQSPYLVMSDLGKKTFGELRESNPDIRVQVSTNSLASSDSWPTYANLHKKKRLWVKDLGFEIYEFRPYPADLYRFVPRYDDLVDSRARGHHSIAPAERMTNPTEERAGPRLGLHSKSIVIDGAIAMIGSHNFDPRSEDFNTEAGLIIRDPVIAKELENNIRLAMEPDNSWVLAPKPRVPVLSALNGVVEAVSNSLPTLDLWPFKRVHAYKLKPGQEAVSIHHPDFYERYELIGRYPEVTLSSSRIQTSVFSAMFGFLAPIL